MNVDGSNKQNLTNILDYRDREPSVSPDNKIVFHSGRDQATLGYSINQVYSMNMDGSNSINLSTIDNTTISNDKSAKFSPDGKKILYLSDRGSSSGSYYLWIMDADGHNKVKISTQNTVNAYWSNDNLNILYTTYSSGMNKIHIYNLLGYTVPVPDSTSNDYAKGWLHGGYPLGNRFGGVVFSSDRSGSYKIYSLNIDFALTKLLANN